MRKLPATCVIAAKRLTTPWCFVHVSQVVVLLGIAQVGDWASP